MRIRESWWLGCVGAALHFVGCGGRTALDFDESLNLGGARATQGGASVGGSFARGGRRMSEGGTLGVGGAAHGGRSGRGGATGLGGRSGSAAGAGGADEGGGAAGALFEAGTGPGGAGGETSVPHDWFVDPNVGNDANPGTRELPFKTLATAAQRAFSQETIWLLSGPVTQVTEPRFAAVVLEPDDSVCGDFTGITLQPGVALRSDTGLSTTLSINGRHGLCATDNALSGLRFERAAPNGYALEFGGGNADLRDVSFSNYSGTDGDLRQSLLVSGDSFVLWTTMPSTQLIADGPAALINQQGRLEIVGGAARLFPTSMGYSQSLFRVQDGATLKFHDVALSGSALDSALDAVVMDGARSDAHPTVEFWDQTTVQGFNFGCRMSARARVVVSQSSFVGQASFSLFLLPNSVGDDARIDVTSSRFEQNNAAMITVAQALTVSIQNSEILNNDTGIEYSPARSPSR